MTRKMLKITSLLLLYLLNVHCKDLILEIVESFIDQKANPCDNFYRHICPKHMPFSAGSLSDMMHEKIISSKNNSKHLFLEYELEKRIRSLNVDTFTHEMAMEFHYVQLENPESAEELGAKIVNTVNKERNCEKEECFKNFYDESIDISHLNLLKQLDAVDSRTLLENMKKKHNEAIKSIILIQHYTKMGLKEKGDKKIRKLVTDLKNITREEIKKTPWVINREIVNEYINILDSIYYDAIFDTEPRKHYLKNENMKYKECLKEYTSYSNIGKYVCLLENYKSITDELPGDVIQTEFNAYNQMTLISSSLPMYFYSAISNFESTFLGLIGAIMGHEIGHSLYATRYTPMHQLYFSNKTIECVQEQVDKLCENFKEISCEATEKNEAENGVDVFGNRVAFDLLKRNMGESINDVIPNTNITHKQMFFYARSIFYCSPVLFPVSEFYVTYNIRVNIFGQMPEFGEAFKCDANSRMLKSSNEECMILGEKASQVKK